MSPLEAFIILHYYVNDGDYLEGDFTSPSVAESIEKLSSVGLEHANGLITDSESDPEIFGMPDKRISRHRLPKYRITKKGVEYVKRMCGVGDLILVGTNQQPELFYDEHEVLCMSIQEWDNLSRLPNGARLYASTK